MILLFALAAIAGSINAQVRPGIKLGYNLGGVMANYLGDNSPEILKITAGDPGNFRMKSGFQAGLIADCPLSDVFAIQPGVRFAMQGFSDRYRSGATNGPEVTRNFSLYSVQVPVYVQYRWKVYEETNVLFQAGPYASFGLFGRQAINSSKTKLGSGDDKYKKITFGNGTSYDIQKLIDYGISAGAGIEFHRFQLVVAYDYGINQSTFKKDAKSGKYNVDMRTHNFSVSLAFVFGRRDPLQNQKD
jgi:hypothetical protein